MSTKVSLIVRIKAGCVGHAEQGSIVRPSFNCYKICITNNLNDLVVFSANLHSDFNFLFMEHSDSSFCYNFWTIRLTNVLNSSFWCRYQGEWDRQFNLLTARSIYYPYKLMLVFGKSSYLYCPHSSGRERLHPQTYLMKVSDRYQHLGITEAGLIEGNFFNAQSLVALYH